MNIIYLLTNLDGKDKKFYIGAKSECRIEIIDELPTIIDIKTERPYLGSATDYTMKEDIKNKNRFSASILKVVNNKKDLLEEENKQIILYNAVESKEYYNHSYAILGGFSYDHNAIINYFGEKRKDFNSSKSGISKRNSTAKKFNFKNLGEFAVWIYKEKQKVEFFTIIAKTLNCERHTPAKFIESYDMEKCLLELNNKSEELVDKVRNLYIKGASFHKIKEILELEIPTISIFMGDFDKKFEREYLTAARKKLTEEELKNKITKLILEGNSVKEAAKLLQINEYSANRYFLKCIRERLKSNDF